MKQPTQQQMDEAVLELMESIEYQGKVKKWEDVPATDEGDIEDE
ncbi:MAG: hypothetical protein Q8K85_09705 [Hyphomicrobium sp.]|nr:hypothetical protein [Hyphomicrobium sp.]